MKQVIIFLWIVIAITGLLLIRQTIIVKRHIDKAVKLCEEFKKPQTVYLNKINDTTFQHGNTTYIIKQ